MPHVLIVARQPSFSISMTASSEARCVARFVAAFHNSASHLENPKPNTGVPIASMPFIDGNKNNSAPATNAIMTTALLI